MTRKIIRSIATFALLTAFLASCGGKGDYTVDEYRAGELAWHDGFTVCQLNDIHLSTLTDLDRQFDYVRKAIHSRHNIKSDFAQDQEWVTDKEPDLLVMNGDSFMCMDREVVNKAIAFFDSLGIPYCFTYGNHDLQGLYSNQFVIHKLQESAAAGHAFYYHREDANVYGKCNYYVNITNGGELAWQIYLMDSNNYYGNHYDIIHDDQIEWYRRCVNKANGRAEYATEAAERSKVLSLLFFHIPTPEWQERANQLSHKETDDEYPHEYKVPGSHEYLYEEEPVSCGYAKNDLLPTIARMKSTVGIGVAHDHINNSDMFYPDADADWPVRLIYGVKTGDGIYHDNDTMGCCFYKLNLPDPSETKPYESAFDLLMLHSTYEDEEATVLWNSVRGN